MGCGGCAAYNRAMLHSLKAQLSALVAPALAERLTLVFNHVLASEAVATERLRPHAGRCLQLVLQDWPTMLPAPPALAWRITPAGLLEWAGELPPMDLTVRLDASNPAWLLARTVGGATPAVQVEGDAQLAGDVNWLMENLRWDVAADLEKLFGPSVAHQLQQFGSALAMGVRAAVQKAEDLRNRWRPRAG
jgi:ubiquinone biosynthesis protein UbiJ